jgi:hypothetical protein
MGSFGQSSKKTKKSHSSVLVATHSYTCQVSCFWMAANVATRHFLIPVSAFKYILLAH